MNSTSASHLYLILWSLTNFLMLSTRALSAFEPPDLMRDAAPGETTT